MATQTGVAPAQPTGAHDGADLDYINAEKGIWSWMSTVDHKRIGVMYLFSVMAMFGLGGFFALVLRTELLTPGPTIRIPFMHGDGGGHGSATGPWEMGADWYNQAFTLHGAIMVFLFIIPSVPAALGNFFLPIMIGAKDVAFPRLNLASFYIYLFGACFALASVWGVDTGWTFYTPYSQHTNGSVISMTTGAFIMGFSSILTGLNFIATVHKLRAPGINWQRLPLFVWGIYATSVIQVLATPVLAITLFLLIMERVLTIGIFNPELGGDPVLFQHFFWFYSHPAVYIMILPGMAVVNELIATFSKRKIFGYMFVAMSSVSLALLGFLVWGHHMFVAGMSDYAELVFSGLTFLVAIPSGVKVFNWVATLYKGSVSFESPMLYALAFLVLFTIGGLTGLFLGSLAVDVHLHDTYFVVAHFHYVMVGGTVFGFLGGIHYWWPKMFGRMYNENLARIAFAFVFIGFNMTFFTQFILGSRGMPRRYYDYIPHFQPLHAFSSTGAYVLGVGFLIMLYMFIDALRNGPKAPPNPWGSAGYEWMTTSPPHPHNFATTPVITRGPYDYHLATDEELSTGFPGQQVPPAERVMEQKAAVAPTTRDASDSDDSEDAKSKDDDE